MEITALVYIMLTMVTVTFAVFINNKDYVQLHIYGIRRPDLSREYAGNIVAEAAIYCLLTGVSACRIAMGNDYWSYADNFRLIAQERYVSSEFGFNYLVKWLQVLFGYGNYLPIFGLFSVITVFFFVKALHDQGEWYAGSLYLLLANGYYFNSMNSIRYYLALAVAMYSMKYVLRKEYGKFILWILAASAIHKSVLLVIPVYIIAAWLAESKLGKWHYIGGGILVLSLIFGQDLYRKIIFFFYPYYENSAFDVGGLSWANILKCLGTLALCLICYKQSIRDQKVNRFYFYLNIFGLLVYTLGSFIPEVSRVGYYMIISQVFLIPNMLAGMKAGKWKILCTVGTAIAFLLYFIMFLYKAYDVNIRLLPYMNWIFQ